MLEAALRSLASGEPGSVSANRIAKDIGATWGAVQYQFGDTDGFWAAVWDHFGVVDHGAIVWDEFVAVWLVLWLVPATWFWQFAGVLVFRFFDIIKPWPIRQADARFKNGMGVMLDDLLAAGYSLVVLAIVWRVLT